MRNTDVYNITQHKNSDEFSQMKEDQRMMFTPSVNIDKSPLLEVTPTPGVKVQSNVDSNSTNDQSIRGKKKQIWIPKAVGIISNVPYYEFFCHILLDFWYSLDQDKAKDINL